jgi:hypothetical protein
MNEYETMMGIAKKQKDCEFSLKFLLRKNGDSYKNFYTMLRLIKKIERQPIIYDYGDIVVGEKRLSIEEGLDIIADLVPEKSDQRQIAIPDCCDFPVEVGGRLDFICGKHRYSRIRSDFSSWFWYLSTKAGFVQNESNIEFIKEGLPYYPSLNDAAIDFLDLHVPGTISPGQVLVIVTDFRARIERLKLTSSGAEVELDSPEIDYGDLFIQAFAKNDNETVCLPEIIPASNLVRYNFEFEPDFLHVILGSRKDGLKIDSKEFTKWSTEEEGISIERSEDDILSLVKIGEGQDAEYKYDVKDENQRNDFIESVVAFSNTNNGLILVGVDDHGEIVGCHTNREDIEKVIHDSCDPPPKGIRIEKKEINAKRVMVVEVPEGDDKPYQSKRDKNFYVRHNADDMRMERSELMRIVDERKRSGGYWPS